MHLRVENNQTIFTCGYTAGQTIRVPTAHHDGNYTRPGHAGPARTAASSRSAAAALPNWRRDNVNSSTRAIAGIFSSSRTVLGPDAYPEYATDPLLGVTDGQGLFDGLVGALQ